MCVFFTFLHSLLTLSTAIDLQQCWFPGVHSNVGGGYADQALANLTLAWMIDRCRPFLDFDSEYISRLVDVDHHPWQWHHDWKDRKDKAEMGEFDMEYQGWGCGMWYDSYKRGQTWSWKYRTPGAYGGATNETIHASVRERWLSRGLRTGPAVWRPKALNGFGLREAADGKWEWVKKDSKGKEALVIQEAQFPSKASFSLDSDQVDISFEGLLRYSPVMPKGDAQLVSSGKTAGSSNPPVPPSSALGHPHKGGDVRGHSGTFQDGDTTGHRKFSGTDPGSPGQPGAFL